MAVLWLFWTWLCACMRRVLGLGLQLAPVPQHVAFIMDGNRRFASVRALEKIAGHRRGYRKLMDVIHWCLDLGVPNISVYAFSIDNFQRSEEEVRHITEVCMHVHAVSSTQGRQKDWRASRSCNTHLLACGMLAWSKPQYAGSMTWMHLPHQYNIHPIGIHPLFQDCKRCGTCAG